MVQATAFNAACTQRTHHLISLVWTQMIMSLGSCLNS